MTNVTNKDVYGIVESLRAAGLVTEVNRLIQGGQIKTLVGAPIALGGFILQSYIGPKPVESK